MIVKKKTTPISKTVTAGTKNNAVKKQTLDKIASNKNKYGDIPYPLTKQMAKDRNEEQSLRSNYSKRVGKK